MPVDAKTITVTAGGFLLVYSGVKGIKVSTTFKDLLLGNNPGKEIPTETPISNIALAGQGTTASGLPGQAGGLSKGFLTAKGNIPAQVSSGPRITKTFETLVLKYLKAPLTKANYDFLTAWSLREGNGGANNPFNTTTPATGATDVPGTPGVKNYISLAQGAYATAQTFSGGLYNDIIAALRSGNISRTQDYQGLHNWSAGPNGAPNAGYWNLAGIEIP